MNGNQVVSTSIAAKLIHAVSRPGWRDKGKRVGLPKPGVGTSVPDWAEHRGKPGWDGPASRILGLILLAVTIPALLIAWYWLFPDHESTPLLVISATAYHAPAPPNAFAAEDVARMRKAYGSYHNIALSEPAEAPKDSASLLDIVRSFLNRAQPGGPDKKVVMIYLSAHGVVNGAGEPCLLLPDHDPLRCGTWLPVSELIKTITQAANLEDCQKIVLLDATRIDDAWRMGVFANTFAIALDSLINETRPANCFVLNASTGLETALAAPEISGTAFGHFVTTGLAGAADAPGMGNSNSVVTLDELAKYLRKEVDSWALSNRAVHQRPTLSVAGSGTESSAKQVKLVYVTETEEISAEPWSPQQPDDGSSQWDRIEKLQGQRAYEQSPLNWGYLQFLVERYDAELLAGSAYRERAGQTFREIRTLLDEIEADTKNLYGLPISLAMCRLNPQFDTQGVAEIWEAWLEKPAEAKPPADYASAADFAWQRLATSNGQVDQASLQQALEFCDFAGAPKDEEEFEGGSKRLEFSEIALVRLLNAHADWQAPSLANSAELQRLLVARRKSERLAAPEDPRQHYAIAQLMRQLDTNLAITFDHILTGDEDSLNDAGDQLDTLLGQGESSYARAGEQSDLFRQALGSRDRAFAALLHLTRFVALRGKFDASYRTRYDLATLTDDTLKLADLLDTTIAESANNDPALDESRLGNLSKRIDETLDEFFRQYNERVAAIPRQEGGSSSDIHVETPHLMRCPIEFGAKRRQLRAQWIKQLQRSSDAKSSPQDDVVEPRGDIEYLNWLLSTGLTPLQRLLNWRPLAENDDLTPVRFELSAVRPDASADELSDQLALLGGSLRARLLEVPSACGTLGARSTEVISRRPAHEARRGWTLADRLTRAVAPLTADYSKSAPARRLRSLDTQALVLWHGHRLLDDFWGHWPPTSEPYFAAAAFQQAKKAEDTFSDAQHGPQNLRDRIVASQATLSAWQPLQAETLAHSDEAMIRHEVKFKGQPDLRPGRAAVYLTDDENHLFVTYAGKDEQRRKSVDTGGGRPDQASPSERINHQISGEDLGDEDLLYANALFRGHVKRTPFSIGRGVSVSWQEPAPAPASIVVRGDAKQISQLIFIVDCSASMATDKRLEVGKRALSNLLDGLVQQDSQYRVGLIFYGRRAKWEFFGKGKGYSNMRHVSVADEDPNINPDADVEIAVSPKLLRDRHANVIKQALKKASPNGPTPLYLALWTALQQFNTSTQGPRHVIAITDGMNKLQMHPGFPPPITKSSKDVDQVRQDVKARIDVIEFGAAGGGRQDLRDITTKSGGSFHQIATASGLAEELKNALRLDRYYLKSQADAGSAISTDLHELGSPTRLPASKLPLDFQVLLEQHTADVAKGRMEGGEALKLVFRQSAQNRLGFERYAPDDTREIKKDKDLLIAAHVPASRLNQPTFRVSIQNGNERWFSPRPEVIWAKVTPLGKNSPRSFYFVDREFETNLPVPMLQLTANGWSGGERARIELSFAMTRSALGERPIPIPAIGHQQFEAHGAALEVESKRTGERQLTISVDEKHGRAAKDYPLHIQLDPQPDRITRTYFESHSQAHHVFYFKVQPSNPKLLVLSRREIESRGVGPIVFENVELPR